jgi:hypothetical protein
METHQTISKSQARATEITIQTAKLQMVTKQNEHTLNMPERLSFPSNYWQKTARSKNTCHHRAAPVPCLDLLYHSRNTLAYGMVDTGYKQCQMQ